MGSSQQISDQNSAPILIKDRSPFYRGFLYGSLIAIAVYAAIFARLLERPSADLTAALAVFNGGDSPLAELAIARAEEINVAAAAYVDSCGPDLAARAWREAGGAEERYQLLSSFMAFSPQSLAEYTPDRFEILLWEELGGDASEQKVELLTAGMTVEY